MTLQTVQLRYLRMTPRKVRLVADLIKGLPLSEAEAQLMLVRKRAAVPLLKLLRSAMANITHNKKAEARRYMVHSIRVDTGPMIERYLPRARGMATPIEKKMSHVTLILAEHPSPIEPRFKIVVKKKTKLPPGAPKKEKPKKTQVGAVEKTPEAGKPGFFKRIFSRKTI